MGLRDGLVNMAKNAAAGAASSFVSGIGGGLRAGLGGSTSSSASSPLQTGYKKQEPGILLYPSDVGTNMHHASYILFARHEVQGGKIKTRKKKLPENASVKDKAKLTIEQVKEFNRSSAAAGKQKDRGGMNKDGSSGSLVLQTKNLKKTGTYIGLYMPPAVNVKYSMDYAQGEIGLMTEALHGAFKSYQSDTLSGGSLLGDAKKLALPAVKQAVLKGVSSVPFIEGASEVAALELGTIIAPRTEIMFKGIGRRKFSFTFTFIPKDIKESEIVHSIVEQFKIGMMPTFKNSGSYRELSIPDIFSIQYMHINADNTYLNKIGKCYLKSMDVTYGGDKFVTYNHDAKGAPPQRTTISLAFHELEVLDRANVKDGF